MFQLAKFNVENHYAVVGVLEELTLSLKVFENYLPHMFFNITRLYQEGAKDPSIFSRPFKSAHVSNQTEFYVNKNQIYEGSLVTPKVRSHLQKSPVFVLEYEFYEFVKQKLHVQAMDLKLM